MSQNVVINAVPLDKFSTSICALMQHDRHPFIDKLRRSLLVGERFLHLIFDAIRQCQVGVVVLLEEFFTRTKWPMLELKLELVVMVEETKNLFNQKLKMIPIFYNISHEKCFDSNVQSQWMMRWRK